MWTRELKDVAERIDQARRLRARLEMLQGNRLQAEDQGKIQRALEGVAQVIVELNALEQNIAQQHKRNEPSENVMNAVTAHIEQCSGILGIISRMLPV